jgi:hypothetical protein
MSDQAGGSQASYDVWWDEEAQIMHTDWAPASVCGESEARACTAAILDLGKGAVPLLVDLREMKKLERGAREHFKVNKAGVSAMALLVGSAVTRMLANFFMRTDTGQTPTRMFTEESAALDWLQEHRP